MANAKITIDIDAKQALRSTNDLENSIGGVVEQSKSAKQELRELKQSLLELEPGTDEFQRMSLRAAELQDRIGDVNRQVKALSSDTLALDQATGVITGMAGAYGAVQGAAALLGVENDALMQTMVKLQAIQNVTNGLTQFSNMLNKDSAAGIALRNIGTRALNLLTVQQTATTTGATVATKALNMAMRALPILAIIGAVTALVSVFISLSNSAKDAQREIDASRKALEDFDNQQKSNAERRRVDVEIEKMQNSEARKSLEDRYKNGEITLREFQKLRIDLRKEEIKQEKQRLQDEIDASKERERLLEREKEALKIGSDDRNQKHQEHLNQIRETKKAENDLLIFRQGIGFEEKELRRIFNAENKQLSESEKNENDKRVKSAQDSAKKRLEILFMISNQEKVLELERMKRTEDFLISTEASDNELIDIREKINEQELNIINSKYDFQIKAAKGNAEQIKLLELQRTGEVERLEQNHQNNIKEINDNGLKRTISRINEEKKLRIENQILQEEILMQEEINLVKTEEEKIKIRESYNDRLKQLQIEQIETERDILLKNTKLTEEQRQNIIKESELNILKIKEEGIKETTEDIETTFQGMMQNLAYEFGKWSNAIMYIVGSVGDFMNMLDQNASIEREARYNRETELLQSQLNERIISEEEYAAKERNLQNEMDAADLMMRRKQFNREKKINIAMAVMNTAQAILQALGSTPPPASFLLAAMSGAAGAIQIGTIAGQKFQAARGGIVPGTTRKNIDSVPSMLAPGEAVINATSASMFPNLLSEVNQLGGGVPLAALPTESGAVTSSDPVYTDNKPMTVKVNVGVQEITDVQDRLTRYNELNEF